MFSSKSFLFDDEPLTGTQFWLQAFVASIFSFAGFGLWLLSSLAYKRSGALGWKNEYRILSAVFVPLAGLSTVLQRLGYDLGEEINLLTIVSSLGLIFHLILIFKNGNLIKEENLETDN
jgi:hypothetical protein